MWDCFVSLARLLCLMVSNFGYYNFIRKNTKLDISFIPIITIGIQFTILFAAGILNLLLITSATMLITGVVMVAIDILHKKISEYKDFATISYMYMGICIVVLFFSLYGSHFSNFDDFSHWATVVRELMVSNHYPNFTNQFVSFLTYPLGTSTYIYYGCLLAGTGENTQMVIQGFMGICAVMPLFSCIRKHKLLALITILFFTNSVLVYNTPLTSLMVDTLLPLWGMGTFLIAWNIYAGCKRMNRNAQKLELCFFAPLLIMTVMIKNSGFFFAIPSLLVIASMWRNDPSRKYSYASVIIAPIVSMILWRQHCSYVIPYANYSKHTVSLQYYAIIFGEKSLEDIVNTGKQLADYMLGYPALGCILLMLLILILSSFFFYKKDYKRTLMFSAAVGVMYFAYITGLYFMYVFSMPQIEANILMEIPRYVGTIDIAVFFLIMAYVLHILDDTELVKKSVPLLLALILFLGSLTKWSIVSGDKNPLPRMWLDDQIAKYDIPEGAFCAIFNSCTLANEYLSNTMRYLLWSPNIYAGDGLNEDNVGNLENFQYILMFDYSNELVSEWIKTNYPEQYGNSVIITD